MSRSFLFAAFLLVATAVQAVSPARESANGGGGTCPEAEAQVANEEPAVTTEPAPPPSAAPATPTPVAAKNSAIARPRNGVRWHSFVPGMFK